MSKNKTGSPPAMLRLGLCLLILAAGAGGFVALKKMKKPPQQAAVLEQTLTVQVANVQPRDVFVELRGLGEIRSRTVVPVSAEVAGLVTFIHKRLDPGEIIEQGEVLLTIDDQDYRLDFESAGKRLEILRRDQELADKEFDRVRSLYEKNKVGTLSSVEQAEASANAVADRISQVEQAMRQAELKLERCTLRAPFACRISKVEVETGEYVSPGKQLFTMVNDLDLEVEVALDSRDAFSWLQFDERTPANGSWFSAPVQVACDIIWTENEKVRGKGRLDRVMRFDPQTRTLVVAVRLSRETSGSFPLVEGMFVRVVIPGRIVLNAFVLPRQAVTYENTVYVAAGERLRTRPVTVVRREEGRAIIAAGLEAGDKVITTRLEQPLENTLLTMVAEREGRQ